ncbi:MAG TPA: porin family protein [Edaphocola sp.]|nr:porin family protein [Edaphocola sp.]
MKKLFIVAAILGLGYGAKAQITFTPEVGYNINKFEGYNYNPTLNERTNINYAWRLNPRAGIAMDIPIGDGGFSIEPGVYYNIKSASYSEESKTMKLKTIQTFNFVEMPINLKFSWEVSQYTGKLFVQASPYISYALSGETIADTAILQPIAHKKKGVHKTDLESDLTIYKRMDYGANFGVGYQFSWGLQVRAIYGRSLSNMLTLENKFYSPGNMFNLSIGYVLNRKIPGRFY